MLLCRIQLVVPYLGVQGHEPSHQLLVAALTVQGSDGAEQADAVFDDDVIRAIFKQKAPSVWTPNKKQDGYDDLICEGGMDGKLWKRFGSQTWELRNVTDDGLELSNLTWV